MTIRMRRICSLAAVPGSLLLADTAFAHPGHGATGFVAGLVHPLTGVDHLAAMTMVGLWSGLAFPRHRLRLPAIMLSALLAGFLYGIGGGVMAAPELLIQATLALIGLNLVLDIKMRSHAAAVLVAMTGLAHGFAHGIEVPPASDPRSFMAGFCLSSSALLAAGLGIATVARHWGLHAHSPRSLRQDAD
jgi:urease accessory protein